MRIDVVDEIKQRLDIVEVIGESVSLRKAGRNYKGLCPFHTEKTPSFVVFPDSGNWHCFGACATGGDLFNFVMRRENMDFPEALKLLAAKAGVELSPLTGEEQRHRDQLDLLRSINAAAADYYHHVLTEMPGGEGARAYLERRGVNAQSIRAFQLGYSPNEWHALDEYLRRKGFGEDDVVAAGLLSENDAGSTYDRFRDRVMFPIRDAQGRVVGFGGRALGDTMSKYLNSPDTPLFRKGSVLYGIDLARESIRQSGTAIVVEGYMDVVIPFQFGITNVIACLGTALTDAHMQVLRRPVKELILALDPDAAGIQAVERGFETARKGLEQRVVPVPVSVGLVRYESQLEANVRVLVLPDGLDPDELVLRDRELWDTLVAEALPVAEFFFRLAEQEEDVSTAKGKRSAADRLIPIIAALDATVERNHYLQRLAHWLRMDERELVPQLERARPRQSASKTSDRGRVARRAKASPPEPTEVREGPLDLEDRCLALLLKAPMLLMEIHEVTDLSQESFQDPRNKLVFGALEAYMGGHAHYVQAEFRGGLDNALSGHVESLDLGLSAGPPLSGDMLRDDLSKSVARLQKSHISALIGDLRHLLLDLQDGHEELALRELTERIEELRLEQRQIEQRLHAVTFAGRAKRGMRV